MTKFWKNDPHHAHRYQGAAQSPMRSAAREIVSTSGFQATVPEESTAKIGYQWRIYINYWQGVLLTSHPQPSSRSTPDAVQTPPAFCWRLSYMRKCVPPESLPHPLQKSRQRRNPPRKIHSKRSSVLHAKSPRFGENRQFSVPPLEIILDTL